MRLNDLNNGLLLLNKEGGYQKFLKRYNYRWPYEKN